MIERVELCDCDVRVHFYGTDSIYAPPGVVWAEIYVGNFSYRLSVPRDVAQRLVELDKVETRARLVLEVSDE